MKKVALLCMCMGLVLPMFAQQKPQKKDYIELPAAIKKVAKNQELPASIKQAVAKNQAAVGEMATRISRGEKLLPVKPELENAENFFAQMKRHTKGLLNEYTPFVTVVKLVVEAQAVYESPEAVAYIVRAIEPEKRSRAENAALYDLVELTGFEESELSALHDLLGDSEQLSPAEQKEYEEASYLVEEVMQSVFDKENFKNLEMDEE